MITDQLRKYIERSGETPYAVAVGAGVSPAVLYRFLKGERTISIETAAKLCEYLRLKLVER